MTTIDLDESQDLSRSKRLKAATHETHERLDLSIMSRVPFETRDRRLGADAARASSRP